MKRYETIGILGLAAALGTSALASGFGALGQGGTAPATPTAPVYSDVQASDLTYSFRVLHDRRYVFAPGTEMKTHQVWDFDVARDTISGQNPGTSVSPGGTCLGIGYVTVEQWRTHRGQGDQGRLRDIWEGDRTRALEIARKAIEVQQSQELESGNSGILPDWWMEMVGKIYNTGATLQHAGALAEEILGKLESKRGEPSELSLRIDGANHSLLVIGATSGLAALADPRPGTPEEHYMIPAIRFELYDSNNPLASGSDDAAYRKNKYLLYFPTARAFSAPSTAWAEQYAGMKVRNQISADPRQAGVFFADDELSTSRFHEQDKRDDFELVRGKMRHEVNKALWSGAYPHGVIRRPTRATVGGGDGFAAEDEAAIDDYIAKVFKITAPSS